MPAAQTISLSMPEPDIALLTFDMPDKGANVLSSSVLTELAAQLDELEQRDDLAGLIVCSGKPGTFIAGADLREFVASLNIPKPQVVELCRRGQTLFGRLAQCPFVTVAAVDGICVGGGAELAAWCDRRVMSDNPKTEFGFPEVKLGLFPGWGGTVRASRIAGLSNAVELVTGGESIDARSAAGLGLADDVVPADELIAAAVRLVRAEQASGDYRRDRQRWSQSIEIDEIELGFLGVTAAAMIQQQTKGAYPAPDAALEVLLEGAGSDAQAALQLEADGMAQLFGSPVNAALLNVFFLTDRNKKDKGVERDDVVPREVHSVGVMGAGIMGQGIAAANIKRGLPTLISDVSQQALARGAQNVLEEAAYERRIKGPDAGKMAAVAPLLNISIVDQEIATCDLIVEAVVEDLEVKRKLYARIEPLLRDDATFASNTSTIPITTLAQNLEHPQRFCGIHFFNPVRRMKLVEVIRGRQTSDETIATAVAYAKRVGKMPIVVNDGPGFLVNRLLFPYMNEALALLAEGAPMKAVERAAKSFGMPMGPLELYDMVGLDTAALAGMVMWKAFPDRIFGSPMVRALVKANRFGQKNGRGFFSYENKRRRPQPDPEVDKLLAPYIEQQREFTPEELANRLFLPMLLEATRVLEDHIVRDPRDIDLGLIFGLGFPPYKGGLMFWADTVGAAQLVEMLKPLHEVGERFQATPLLTEMAADGRKFYPALT